MKTLFLGLGLALASLVPASATDFAFGAVGAHGGLSGTAVLGGAFGLGSGPNVQTQAMNENAATATLKQKVGTQGFKLNSKISTGSTSSSGVAVNGNGAGVAGAGGFGAGLNIGAIGGLAGVRH